jgi:hypothetical protein
VTVWQTVLVFAVAPLGGLAVLAALTFAPGTSRSPRYRVGRSWEYEPVWYIARPDISAPAGSAEGRAALAAASRRELTGTSAAHPGEAPASVLDVDGAAASGGASALKVDGGTARGGASGEW